jgi:hypothetical protein
MPRTQRNDNFIDKTFTVIADILLQVLPTSQREKQAFRIIEMECLRKRKVNTPKLYKII